MIGTASEMLLFFSYKHETAERLGVSIQRLRRMRTRVEAHNFSEETLVDMLSKLDCKCIRPAYTIPAVIQDGKGRLYSEDEYARLYLTQKFADKWEFSLPYTLGALTAGKFLRKDILKHLVRSKGAKIVEDRMEMESIWVYDPIDYLFDDAKIVDIRRMLHITQD